ncbi:hypothetical protein ACT8ZV_19900 [Nocardioides sp. MAHUQ-72]|uniref:hypothetical protein n=1 Tax=unclassified Nocardioides TaxID=2615069 RepID=UPI00360A3CAF
MLVIVLVMLVILVLAGLVVAFVAFPHRGEELPAAPWLGDAMTKAVEALPIVENVDGVPDGDAHASGLTARRGDARRSA